MDGKKVLIVDDEEPLRRVLVDELAQQGFTALSAKDGLEGLRIAKTEHPDVILLDLIMPNMDGLTMLEKLRRDSWGATAQVILLTNSSDLRDVERALRFQAYDFLVKSNWSLDNVVKKIREKINS
ncbi:MAG: response regulator [Candidatus Kerfeldbacteria bacterium]|nr:response regulator [Candidatus Kerfeldbacteria bacterium]